MLAIYCRVSTDEQANNGISLDNQVLRGKELAAKLGVNYKVYTDAGYSGTIPFNKRASLNNLINDIYSQKVKSIFVTDLDRLSRGNIVEINGLMSIFKDNNVRLFDLNQEINLRDINQELLTNMRSLLNAFEIKKTSARIKTVLEKNVKEDGKVSGGPIINYGYTKENKKLIIDEHEAEIVRLIYKLALEGKGTKVISRILNEKEIPTKRGNITTGKQMTVRGIVKTEFLWRDAVIYRILTGTIYKGIREYNGEKLPFNQSLQIIDETTFDLVQDKLKTRDPFKDTTNKYNFLLKGLIHCPVCGGMYYGHKKADGSDNAYTCNSNRYGPNCGNRGIGIDFLDDLIKEDIKNLNSLVSAVYEETMFDVNNHTNEIELQAVQKSIAESKQKISNLLNLLELNGVEETIKNRIQERQKELDCLLLDEIRFKKELDIFYEKDKLVALADKLVSEFETLKTFEDIRNFIRNIIDKIIIGWDKALLQYSVNIIYKINNIENYLISKELILDRNSRKDGKAVTKILSEKIGVQRVYVLENNIDKVDNAYTYQHINYGDAISID